MKHILLALLMFLTVSLVFRAEARDRKRCLGDVITLRGMGGKRHSQPECITSVGRTDLNNRKTQWPINSLENNLTKK